MFDFIIRLLINAIAIFVIGYVLSGVKLKSFGTALWVAILLAIINTLVRPIVLFLTIPLSIITFGLFILVVNALMLMLADWIADGLEIKNFWWALLVSLILALLNLGFY